jgi:hypothetical protein
MRKLTQRRKDAKKKQCALHFFFAPLRLCVSSLLLFLLTGNHVAFAQSLSLPLQGYYHPGRAMPVQWQSPAAGGAIQLSTPGAVTTRIDSIGNTRGIFPWLIIDSNVGEVSDRTLPPLRPLDDNDSLVVDTLDNDSVPNDLFPNHHIVTVHVDAADLASPPMAWQSVDAILLTSQTLQTLSSYNRIELFSYGIELEVQGDEPPEPHSGWIPNGHWWTLSSGLKLPPLISPDAYAPTEGWTPGRTPEFRRRIVLFASIYCLIVCGIGLWRSRWNLAAIFAASAVACILFAWDDRNESHIFQQAGVIELTGQVPREDQWLYQVSHRPADFRLPADGNLQPVLSDRSQLDPLNLVWECDGNGEPISMTGRLSPDIPLATMHRQIAPITSESPALPVTTPLRLLATPSLYPGYSIAGQLNNANSPEYWPTLILDRK